MKIKINDNERLIITSSTGNELEVWADNMGELRVRKWIYQIKNIDLVKGDVNRTTTFKYEFVIRFNYWGKKIPSPLKKDWWFDGWMKIELKNLLEREQRYF